jgi:DNA gyrase inhibitor GyrI
MKKVIIILLIIIAACFGFLVYSGLFATVSVTERVIGPYTLVYLDNTGPYSQSYKTHEKVHGVLKQDFSLDPQQCFGLYFDDPASVPEDKLRSEIGCVLDRSAKSKIPAIRGKLKIKEYAAQKSVVVEFPMRNMFSFMIGPMMVYKEMGRYMKEKGYKGAPALELYDGTARKIFYTMPVVQ